MKKEQKELQEAGKLITHPIFLNGILEIPNIYLGLPELEEPEAELVRPDPKGFKVSPEDKESKSKPVDTGLRSTLITPFYVLKISTPELESIKQGRVMPKETQELTNSFT